MSKIIDRSFYIWTMEECIKSTYENWGIDITSMLDRVEKDFPNVYKAFEKLYDVTEHDKLYLIQPVIFENPQNVYEVISNLLFPNSKDCLFNLYTETQNDKYEYLNMCSWNEKVNTNRFDLLLSTLLFTEDFILEPISSKKVILNTKDKLIICNEFVTLNIYINEGITYICIDIHEVIKLQFQSCKK